MISIDRGRKSSFATYGYISMFQNGNPALIQDSRQVRQHNFLPSMLVYIVQLICESIWMYLIIYYLQCCTLPKGHGTCPFGSGLFH